MKRKTNAHDESNVLRTMLAISEEDLWIIERLNEKVKICFTPSSKYYPFLYNIKSKSIKRIAKRNIFQACVD